MRHDAVAACERDSAHLVTIEDLSENKFVESMFR